MKIPGGKKCRQAREDAPIIPTSNKVMIDDQ